MTADMPAQDLRSAMLNARFGSGHDQAWLYRPQTINSGRPAKAVLVVAPVVSRRLLAGPD